MLYGFATAVSFSRVPTRAHFPSDVFLGAGRGYTIAKYPGARPAETSQFQRNREVMVDGFATISAQP